MIQPLLLDVPERPALSPSVHLMGEMTGTSFVDRQWLVQRNGGFLQLSELLYRVAEHADGNRTLEQIAAKVTDATPWHVTADHVRQLLRAKLIPLGLVAAADAGGVALTNPAGARQRPSPIGLNLRFRLFGERAIDAAAARLQMLFAPPVLIPVVVILAIAHAWLYFGHRVAGSIGAALFTPGALLVVLAIIIVSCIVHEFGHASALRYGGGRAREIGGGFYLFLPALYTDVTDSYRLGRWARVRTGLGGVYFHLIFALGLMALYWLSGQELLLFIVLLINVDVLRQFVPFVRFDGYWVLADLVGVPDFFSQMRPFVRSVLRSPGSPGSRLPRLKPWARAIFAGYIILTVPILSMLMLLLVVGAPYLIALTWDAVAVQRTVFAIARANGDWLVMSASVTQVLLLVLPVCGMMYLLYITGRRLISAVWKWSTTPARRLTAGLGTSGAVVVLSVLWMPELPPAGVERFDVDDTRHTSTPVTYPHMPPVGGAHTAAWQNCGYYETPVRSEHAVASLAHGAVWITYGPDLPSAHRDVLRRLAREERLVLVSPLPALPVPVVASAWGRQLRLESAADPRLDQFVDVFKNGFQAPERGGPCSGGIGAPVVTN